MDLCLFIQTILINPRGSKPGVRSDQPQDQVHRRGERGEVVLPFVLTIGAASLLFVGLFLLNKLYEYNTKEHLHDFENRWQELEVRYKD